MAAVIGSSHTGLQVSDLERSIRFYVDLLGLRVRDRRILLAPTYVGEIVGFPRVEMHQAFLDIPGSKHWLELLEYHAVSRGQVDPSTGNIGTAHFCLRVDGLQEMYDRLMSRGVRFISPPVSPTAGPNVGGLVVYMLDPDEIRVELVQTKSEEF